MPLNAPSNVSNVHSSVETTEVVNAPASWRAIDLISDLHLQASHPDTFAAWRHYMAQTPTDALFILGDLFEVWVGDDIVGAANDAEAAFVQQCQITLQATAQRLPIYFMHGNRDFLLGTTFAKACGMTLLNDPSVLNFNQQRWLLSHGDELCLGDVDYQQFRQQVRSSNWQTGFLAKPLPERQTIAHGLRTQSASRKACGASYADVDDPMAVQWLAKSEATTLIHGHTHHPADHNLSTPQGKTLRRIVLSDWDANAAPPRLEVLRLTSNTPPQRLKVSTTPSARSAPAVPAPHQTPKTAP